jgi:hypothetical protein
MGKHGPLDIPEMGSSKQDCGLQLELNLWNTLLVQADHPTYTICCRQDYQCSELLCDCDIRCWSGTLLWGHVVWRRLLLVSSVKQVSLLSRPGNIEVGPARNSSMLLFHTSWGQMSVQKRHLNMPNVLKDWLPFSTRSCRLVLVTTLSYSV